MPAKREQKVPGRAKGIDIDLEGVTHGDESVEMNLSNSGLCSDNANNSKIAPRLLKKPPVQSMIAVGQLPTVKDQAGSIAAPATRATHQLTENAGNNIPVGTDTSTEDFGPDFKDQVRTVQPPPPKLPSAEGVPVSSIHEEPSTVIAVVIETMDDSAVANDDDDGNAAEEEPPQLDEDHEPPRKWSAATVRKHLFWAVTLLVVVVAGVVVAVVVALTSSSGEDDPPPPPFAQETKLTASDGAAFDYFGLSVAIANDTVVVGAYWNVNDNSDRSGSAYVFTHTGTTGTQQAKLTASDGVVNDRFGISVAIASDTIVVGATRDDTDNVTDSGSAYVFVRTGTTWTEQAKLTTSDGAAEDYFGRSVAIDG